MAYVGFKKLEKKLEGENVRDAGAVAASIGRKKYGAENFQKHAAMHETMEHSHPLLSAFKKRRG